MTRRISSGVAAEIAGQGSTTTVVDEAAGVRVHRPAGVIVQASSGAMIVSRVASPDARVVRVAGDKLPAPGNICEDIAAELRLADDRLAGDLATARTELGADVALAHADASAARTDAAAARSEAAAARTELGADVALAHADASAARSEAAAVVARMDDLDPIVTIIQSDVAGAGAAIVTEQGVRAAADEAISASVDALTTRVGAAESGLTTEQTTRADETTALSNSLTALTTRVGAAESGLTSEQTTRATADTALSNSLSVVSAKLYYDVAGCFNNSNFGNWPDGATFPAGLSDWYSVGSGRAINRVAGRRSPWAMELVAPDAMDMGVLLNSRPSNANASWVGPSGLRYYTLTIEVELIAGDFQRAGWYIAGYNGDAGVSGCWKFSLFTIDVPAPVVGKTYTIARVIDLCAGGATEDAVKTATGYNMHIFANWSGFAGSYSAKTLRIHQWHIRPATAEEIRTFNVAGEISAAVQTETTTRATADTALSNSLTALTTRVGAAESGLTTEQTTRADETTALSNSLTALTTRVGAAESGLTTEQTTRSTADTALSNSLTALTTRVGAAESGLTTEQTTRADETTALSNSLTALTTRVGAAESGLTTEQTTRSTADTALSNSLTALTTRVGAAESGLTTEQTTRADETTALSNSLTALTTRVGAAESGLTTEQTTRATADTALSNSVTTLTAKLYYDVAGCFNNSNFGNWADGATFPAGLNEWNSMGSGRAINRVAGRRSPWAMEMVAPDAMDMGVGIYCKPADSNQNWVGPSGLRYYTLIIEVEVVSGDLNRAGWYIAGLDNSNIYVPGCIVYSPFTVDIPAPVAGKTYTIAKVIDLCSGGATATAVNTVAGYNMHIFSNWSGFAGNYSAKTLRIHQWHIRPATAEEIRTFNVAGEISAAVQTETTARVADTSAIAQSVTTLSSQLSSTTATLTQTAQTVDGLSLRYGIQGTINGQTGGFQFTGVLKNDGSVAYNLEIVSNVTILGDLLVAGTVRNAGLEDLAATNSVAASSPAGSNTTGDVTMYVRKNSRVKLTVCQTAASACDVQIYIGGFLYRTVNLVQHVSHVCIAPLNGVNVFTNGTATASSTQSGYYASSAFDMNTESSWRSAALPTVGAPIYLTYQLPVAKSITQYSVTSKTYIGFTPPTGWVLQGSANGSTWVDIDTISSPGFGVNGVVIETKTYTITATTAYLYFRLKFTTNAGYKIAVCEFTAHETAPGDQNIVFKATNSSVASNVTGGVELIIEEFSK